MRDVRHYHGVINVIGGGYLSIKLLLRHIGRVHRNSSDFLMTCGLDVDGTCCATTFTNFHEKHREVPSTTEEELSDNEVENSEDVMEAAEVECDTREFTEELTLKILHSQI